MYFLHNLANLSSVKIGKLIGDKDHTTVLHAIKTINNLIETDINFKNKINKINNELGTIFDF